MYAELHALSNFSFLRGASHPEELVEQAKQLGYRGLALTDECSLAGAVRAHIAAKQHGLPLIIGTELNCIDGLKLVVLATDRASYGAMSRLISRARRASPKGRYTLGRNEIQDALAGLAIIWLARSDKGPGAQVPRAGTRWRESISRMLSRDARSSGCRVPTRCRRSGRRRTAGGCAN